MSTPNTTQMTCPKCSTTFDIEQYNVINAQTQLVLRHERCDRGFVHARLERDEEFLFVVAVHAGVRGVHVRAATRTGLQKYRTVE